MSQRTPRLPGSRRTAAPPPRPVVSRSSEERDSAWRCPQCGLDASCLCDSDPPEDECPCGAVDGEEHGAECPARVGCKVDSQ
jgi:hypothetical protein